MHSTFTNVLFHDKQKMSHFIIVIIQLLAKGHLEMIPGNSRFIQSLQAISSRSVVSQFAM